MKAVLELELIADNLYEDQRFARRMGATRNASLHEEISWLRFANKRLRPWVARLTGLKDGVVLQREFIRYQTKDYARANSAGSRGIYAYYVLNDGIYEVNKRENWKRARRYFIRVTDGSIAEISRDEVLECLESAD